MSTITQFEELDIWKDARELCKETRYLINHSEDFLKDYALRDQISRSTGLIMDNIAEGFGRGGN